MAIIPDILSEFPELGDVKERDVRNEKYAKWTFTGNLDVNVTAAGYRLKDGLKIFITAGVGGLYAGKPIYIYNVETLVGYIFSIVDKPTVGKEYKVGDMIIPLNPESADRLNALQEIFFGRIIKEFAPETGVNESIDYTTDADGYGTEPEAEHDRTGLRDAVYRETVMAVSDALGQDGKSGHMDFETAFILPTPRPLALGIRRGKPKFFVLDYIDVYRPKETGGRMEFSFQRCSASDNIYDYVNDELYRHKYDSKSNKDIRVEPTILKQGGILNRDFAEFVYSVIFAVNPDTKYTPDWFLDPHADELNESVDYTVDADGYGDEACDTAYQPYGYLTDWIMNRHPDELMTNVIADLTENVAEDMAFGLTDVFTGPCECETATDENPKYAELRMPADAKVNMTYDNERFVRMNGIMFAYVRKSDEDAGCNVTLYMQCFTKDAEPDAEPVEIPLAKAGADGVYAFNNCVKPKSKRTAEIMNVLCRTFLNCDDEFFTVGR